MVMIFLLMAKVITTIFSGKRIKRGLYRSSQDWLINADVNGAANILKKGISSICKRK